MEAKQAFIEELKTMPIAVETRKANDQHYMIPTEFYKLVLGPCVSQSLSFELRNGNVHASCSDGCK